MAEESTQPALPPGASYTPPPLPPGASYQPPALPAGATSQPPVARNPNAPDPVGYVAGLAQGVLDIPEAVGQMGARALGTTLPDWAQGGALRRRAQESNPGKAGELVGSLGTVALQPELGIGAAARAAPYVGRGLEWLWNAFHTGTLPAVLQPTSSQTAAKPGEFWKEKGEQAGIGTALGAVAGLPGAAARALGYRDVPALLRAMESHSPQFVQKTFDALRQLSIPGFNRAWYQHVLEPLGLKMPDEVGHAGMAKLDDMIGKELDRATAGMTLDARAGTPAATALGRVAQTARDNLMSTGNAATAFSRIINETFNRPMAFNMNRLTSDQLQQIAANLKSRIDGISQFSPENRALRRELENFRQAIFDQASGGDKTRYQAAREAWRRFAVGREATPPTEQMFTPSGILTQMDRRNPYQVPLGRARGQDVAQAGHEALLLPGRAAQRAQRGLPPRRPSAAPLTPSLSAAAAQVDANRRRSRLPEITVTAPRYRPDEEKK